MAWDDTAAREFAGGLANSYFMGADPLGYHRAQLSEQEMALRRAADARAAAQEARLQAAHEAEMRSFNRTYGLTDEVVNAVGGAGLAIPEGQMGADGFGPPTPAGLKTPGLSQDWLRSKQLQIAASRNDNAGITALRQEGEATQLDSGLADYMTNVWGKMTPEQKLQQDFVKKIFNGNIQVRGELVVGKEGADKGKVLLSNYDGHGGNKPVDPDLLDRLAAANFLNMRGRGGEALKTSSAVGTDYYNRTRQGVQDNNAALTSVHSAGIQDANLDINRAQLGISRANQGLQAERLNKPVWQQFIGPDGKPVLVDMNAVKMGADGTAQLPSGVQFPKQTLDASALLRYRSELVTSGMPPLEVEREMARVTGGVDPMAALADNLRKANAAAAAAAAAKKENGVPQTVPARQLGLSIPETMPGGQEVPRRTGVDAIRDWRNSGKPLLDYMTGK